LEALYPDEKVKRFNALGLSKEGGDEYQEKGLLVGKVLFICWRGV